MMLLLVRLKRILIGFHPLKHFKLIFTLRLILINIMMLMGRKVLEDSKDHKDKRIRKVMIMIDKTWVLN